MFLHARRRQLGTCAPCLQGVLHPLSRPYLWRMLGRELRMRLRVFDDVADAAGRWFTGRLRCYECTDLGPGWKWGL